MILSYFPVFHSKIYMLLNLIVHNGLFLFHISPLYLYQIKDPKPRLHQVYQTALHFDYANSKKALLDETGMTSSREDREGKAVGDLHDFLFRKSVN